MKKIILTAICGCLAFIAFSQAPNTTLTIKGLVIDSIKKKPLSYITVSVNDAATLKPVRGMQTKGDGTFELTGVPVNSYQLKISEVGYKIKIIPVSPAGKTIVDLGNIGISPSATQLREVAITGEGQVVKQEVDRTVYNVQADPDSKAFDVLEMIRKVPLLSVDADDNIELKGSSNYKILIDGKESALMAHNPSDVLKSMPATNIERIEVITTPPAKYDAEGLAGIINIITKKQRLRGYNGSLNGRLNNVYGPAINLNTTIREGKFGISIFGGYSDNGHTATDFGTTQIFLPGQSLLEQSGTHIRGGNVDYGNATLSYEIDSLHLLTGNIDFFSSMSDPASNQLSSQSSNTGFLDQQYDLNTIGHSTSTGWDAGLNYQLGFKKSKEQLLTLSYFYNYAPNQSFINNAFSDNINFVQPNYQQYNHSGNRTQTFQLDYVQPIEKILQIEAGAKAILRNNFSNFYEDIQNTTLNQYIVDPAQTDDFSYRQDVYSLYNSYQLKYGNWAAKGGWRYEYTGINANFVSTASTNLKTSYHNIVPSLSLQRKFKNSSINFGYTERIQRPGIAQLNPFVNLSNPQFVSTGNPALKPEVNHTFELNYSHIANNTITTGFSYVYSNNSIQNVSYTSVQTANNKPDTITTSTYQNVGINKTLSYNLSANLNITKQLGLNASGQLLRIWLAGAYDGEFYRNGGLIVRGFGGSSYLFDDGIRFSANLAYSSGRINLEGRSGYGINSQFLLSKAFLAHKLNLSLVANNPYTAYKNSSAYTNTPSFLQTTYNQNVYRTFAIRFNYKFGKLQTDIEKNKRGINNDDVKQGENGR